MIVVFLNAKDAPELLSRKCEEKVSVDTIYYYSILVNKSLLLYFQENQQNFDSDFKTV